MVCKEVSDYGIEAIVKLKSFLAISTQQKARWVIRYHETRPITQTHRNY